MKKNIRKVKKFQKTLMFLLIILGFVLGMTVEKIMKANADEINYEYESNNIDYDNSNSNLNATNVKDAIDELYSKVGHCPTGYECFFKENIENYSSNIIRAYVYDENNCITGDETYCKKTMCYLSKNAKSCSVGTIIDYKVNNNDTLRFHVLHDDGEKITLQTQRNIVYNTSWNAFSGNDSTKGPVTIMAALKAATDDWINVNTITITSDITEFEGGISSAPSYNVNYKYDFQTIANVYKARLITIYEAQDEKIGSCKLRVSDSERNDKSCRMFMNNFLYNSTDELHCKNTALCVEDDPLDNGTIHNNGYWTMSMITNTGAFVVNNWGNTGGYFPPSTSLGARAVVVIDK